MSDSEPASFSESRWVDLLDLIEIGKVIPIVGRRMSLAGSGDGPPVPFHMAAADSLARELHVECTTPDQGLTELYVSATNRNAYNADAFHPKLKRVIGAMTPALDPLRKIAEVSGFRLFLSTAIDGFLEQAVREVCGERGQTVASFTFAPGYENPQRPLEQYGDVCVYNLLGGRDTCPNWAVTVEALVEFVLALQSEKYRPERLFDALKDHHLLAIGCQLHDWLGRFFLRSLREGPISAQQASNFVIESEQDADTAFAHYLTLFSKQSIVFPGDPFAFVDDLNRRWKERGSPAPKPAPDRESPDAVPESSGKVFISYCHADRSSAQELYEFLRAQRIDVWKDDRDDAIEKGAYWDRAIARQIADCACFVPVVSRATGERSEGYFWKEWNQARDRLMQVDSTRRRFVFPVLCEEGLAPPEQFSEMQWTMLTDKSGMEALASSLRKEQQRFRKERGRA